MLLRQTTVTKLAEMQDDIFVRQEFFKTGIYGPREKLLTAGWFSDGGPKYTG
jgi:hypothetical protein